MCLSAAPTFFFRGSAFNDACADTAPVLSVTNFSGIIRVQRSRRRSWAASYTAMRTIRSAVGL